MLNVRYSKILLLEISNQTKQNMPETRRNFLEGNIKEKIRKNKSSTSILSGKKPPTTEQIHKNIVFNNLLLTSGFWVRTHTDTNRNCNYVQLRSNTVFEREKNGQLLFTLFRWFKVSRSLNFGNKTSNFNN